MITCVRLPYFVAAVERRRDERLQRKPLVVGGQAWEVKPVYATSAESAAAGVYRGLPLREAHALCPRAAFLPNARRQYQQTVADVDHLLQIVADATEPLWAYPAALYYLPCDEPHESLMVRYAQQIGRLVRSEAGLPLSVGIGPNKFTAYMAAKVTRAHRLRVVSGMAADFLAPLPLDALSLSADLRRRLQLFGLRRLGDFAALPADDILTQFGAQGVVLHQLARGVDPRPVQPPPRALQESRALPFDEPIEHFPILENVLRRFAADFGRRLTAHQLAAREVHLTLTLSDGAQFAPYASLAQPVQSEERLFFQLKRLLYRHEYHTGVGEIAVTLADLLPVEVRQLTLFDVGHTAQAATLSRTIETLTDQYGSEIFLHAEPLQLDAPLPERRFKWRKAAGSRETAFFPLAEQRKIQVTCTAEGQPAAFAWNGVAYTVAEVVKAWRVDVGWWAQPTRRDYYKIRCTDDTLVTVYHAADDGWVLFRHYD